MAASLASGSSYEQDCVLSSLDHGLWTVVEIQTRTLRNLGLGKKSSTWNISGIQPGIGLNGAAPCELPHRLFHVEQSGSGFHGKRPKGILEMFHVEHQSVNGCI